MKETINMIKMQIIKIKRLKINISVLNFNMALYIELAKKVNLKNYKNYNFQDKFGNTDLCNSVSYHSLYSEL